MEIHNRKSNLVQCAKRILLFNWCLKLNKQGRLITYNGSVVPAINLSMNNGNIRSGTPQNIRESSNKKMINHIKQ